ncbi:Exostoses (Multiple)-like 3 [Chytriomyces hyalinus]|nr:Exostoses (Multiple)-like 3 [Chytriomyces hyalinus]
MALYLVPCIVFLLVASGTVESVTEKAITAEPRTIYSPSPPAAIRLSVHIFVDTDIRNFKRLWRSLNDAHPVANTSTEFQLHMIQSSKKRAQNNREMILSAATSKHGTVQSVRIHNLNRSERQLTIGSWIPKSRHEYAIFLNDSSIVSPHIFTFAYAAISKYFDANVLPKNVTSKCAGISLQTLHFDAVHNKPFYRSKQGPSMFAAQFPQMRGVLLAPGPWIRFRKWTDSLPEEFDPLLPNSMTNRGFKHAKKYHLRYMFQSGGFMIYPNESLLQAQWDLNSTNIPVSTLDEASVFDESFAFPPLSEMEVYNAYFQRVDSVEKLTNLPSNPAAFDKCTMIMNAYDRVDTLINRLRHYETLAKLDRIIVVWNHQTLEPPFRVSQPHLNNISYVSNTSIPEEQFKVPVHIIRQLNSSLNNRFLPFKEIQTDCVIAMDDDLDYRHSHLEYAIRLFQGDFFNHAIGFKHMARMHRKQKDGTWKYMTDPQDGASIVLPTGMVFHRKYLVMYSYALPQHARDIVDSKVNGEDILFNLMVANATRSGPVFVNLFSRGIALPGLWWKPAHMENRSLCLTRLIKEVFGGVSPLMYTTSFFKGVGKDGLMPGLKDLNCVNKWN